MTGTVTLDAAGRRLATWARVEIQRDLQDLSGSFRLSILDEARSAAALGGAAAAAAAAVAPGDAVTLALDGEPVLVGWVDEVVLFADGERLQAQLLGRDKAGDLVDCAAAPDGPAEYAGLTLDRIVAALIRPFGLTVKAEVDVGRPFARFGLDPGETVAEAIEKACRQRGLLCVSDGIGGLVLTRGGRQPAPGPLRWGAEIAEAEVRLSQTERYSEVVVKGQTEGAGGARAAAPPLDGAVPAGTPSIAPGPSLPSAPPPATARERAGVVMTGRARDAAIRRYRPRVVLAPTQSGGPSVQDQADWAVRVQRGRGTELFYTVLGWRAGGRLWRPNEVALVQDPYAGIAEEMLVVGVTYLRDEFGGTRTRLRLAGRDAFDVLAEPEDRARQRPAAAPAPRPLDGSVPANTPRI